MDLVMVRTSSNGRVSRSGDKPTIDDVAREAGVSRTTVSRVLNNGANVRPSVRELVMQTVDRLGFKANAQARALAAGNGAGLALVHQSDLDTEPNSYYHAALELGALRACAVGGFQIMTRTVSSDVTSARREIEAMFVDGQVSGVILTPPLSDDAALNRLAADSGFNIACVSADPDSSWAGPAFGIDDFAAGRDLARHLIALGHRRFAYAHGLPDHRSAERRFAGLKQALAEAGLADAAIIEEAGTFTFKSGIDCAERIIARGPPMPTALMCANDDMAAGALLALHRAGIAIPGEISVTGFDGTPISEIVWPPLTTMSQPIKQIGTDAARQLIAASGGDRAARSPRRFTAQHQLIVRQSTGAPPAA